MSSNVNDKSNGNTDHKLLLVISELENATIRKTADGKYSVFDVIEICGAKNPRETWKRVIKAFPESVGKCDDAKLPARAILTKCDDALEGTVTKCDDAPKGRLYITPVSDREGILYLIGLLPGKVGKAYREAAARLVAGYMDADLTLAQDIVNRSTDIDGLKALSQTVTDRLEWLEGKQYKLTSFGSVGCTRMAQELRLEKALYIRSSNQEAITILNDFARAVLQKTGVNQTEISEFATLYQTEIAWFISLLNRNQPLPTALLASAQAKSDWDYMTYTR